MEEPWQRGENTASPTVVLGDFGCDVTCQACRENSPRTPPAIALGSKPPLVTQIARTGLGKRLVRALELGLQVQAPPQTQALGPHTGDLFVCLLSISCWEILTIYLFLCTVKLN